MTLISLEDVFNPTDLREYDTIEHAGNVYLCQKGTPEAGVLAAITHEGSVAVVDGQNVNTGFLFNLRYLAKAEEVNSIRNQLNEQFEGIVKKVKALPAITLSIIYDKKYEAKAQAGDMSFTCTVFNGYVMGELHSNEEKTTCKFSYSAKHDTIEKKACSTLIYQLFGEEMVYIKNRITALL